MPRKLVDVFDRSGGKLFTYSIVLEDADCLDGEFEEVALIFAESSGLVATEEVVHLRACCERSVVVSEAAAIEPSPKGTPRPKSTVLSMVKHRMKKAAAAGHAHRIRHVS